MIYKTVTIVNKLGLHARASAKLVNQASRFLSKIELKHGNQTVNSKSIMGVMMLGAHRGMVLELMIDGEDEQAAAEAIITLIENRFGEMG